MIICDIDNVLADDSWRLHLIDWDERDPIGRFDAYHSACPHDPAPSNLHLLQGSPPVILLTCQPAIYALHRLKWLAAHEVPHDMIMFRNEVDQRSSPEVKRDMVADLIDNGIDLSTCVSAIDDRVDVLKMYRKVYNLPVHHVEINNIEWRMIIGKLAGVRAITPPRTLM